MKTGVFLIFQEVIQQVKK